MAKRKRVLNAELNVIADKFTVPLNTHLRVKAAASTKLNTADVSVKSNLLKAETSPLHIKTTPFALVSTRLDVNGRLYSTQQARVEIQGYRQYAEELLPAHIMIPILKQRSMKRFYNE